MLLLYMGFIFAFSAGGLVSAFANPHRRDDLGEKIALIVVVVVLGGLLMRIARSATLIASGSGVVVRNVLKTHHWSWADLDAFEEVAQPVGASGVPRRFPRAHLAGGGSRNLTELNDSRRRDPDVVAELVGRLNGDEAPLRAVNTYASQARDRPAFDSRGTDRLSAFGNEQQACNLTQCAIGSKSRRSTGKWTTSPGKRWSTSSSCAIPGLILRDLQCPRQPLRVPGRSPAVRRSCTRAGGRSMSELSLAITAANGLDRPPVTITLSNGDEATYKAQFDSVVGDVVVEVPVRDVEADPAKLGWVRSFGTFGGEFYIVRHQAWMRHLDQDGNPRLR